MFLRNVYPIEQFKSLKVLVIDDKNIIVEKQL